MIDHKFHTSRSRDPVARQERRQVARRGTGDSLAELARLSGQGANGGRHDTHSPARSADGGSSGLNWAAENAYPEQRQLGEVAPRRAHRSESMSLCRKTASIRQRLTMFNAATTGSRFRPAEIIGRRFSRATKYRRSRSRRPMTDTMPIPSPPRLAKFTVPTIITLISRTRAGGTVSSSWRCWLWRCSRAHLPTAPRSAVTRSLRSHRSS